MVFGAPSNAQKAPCDKPHEQRSKVSPSVPLDGLKRWDHFVMKTLFDEIISKKLQNTPDGIAATATIIIDLKFGPICAA